METEVGEHFQEGRYPRGRGANELLLVVPSPTQYQPMGHDVGTKQDREG